MPNITVHLTDNLTKKIDTQKLLDSIVINMYQDFPDHFTPEFLRAKSVINEFWYVPKSKVSEYTLFVEIHLLVGRSDELKANIAKVILDVCKSATENIEESIYIGVEFIDMERKHYFSFKR